MLVAILTIAVGTVAVIVLAHGAWWTLLSLIAIPPPWRRRATEARPPRLAVVIPAHNEEGSIAATLESLAASPCVPPAEIIVVADNCTDATAVVAARRGVTVLTRCDPQRRGKSFALDSGIRYLAGQSNPVDAVVFVDADTTVSSSFLTAAGEALAEGASALQVHYIAEPGDQPLTRLRHLAFLLVHWARPLGAARLGLGCGLKGNGMAIRLPLIREGVGAAGIAEDAGMTLALAARGIVPVFVPNAWVSGRMAGTYRTARVQDRRWEAGRLGLSLHAIDVAARAALRGRWRASALALDVASLPLSLLVFGGCVSLAGLAFAPELSWLFIAAPGALVLYVVAGLAASRPRARELFALAHAPRFLAYKARVYGSILFRRPAGWERTAR